MSNKLKGVHEIVKKNLVQTLVTNNGDLYLIYKDQHSSAGELNWAHHYPGFFVQVDGENNVTGTGVGLPTEKGVLSFDGGHNHLLLDILKDRPEVELKRENVDNHEVLELTLRKSNRKGQDLVLRSVSGLAENGFSFMKSLPKLPNVVPSTYQELRAEMAAAAEKPKKEDKKKTSKSE